MQWIGRRWGLAAPAALVVAIASFCGAGIRVLMPDPPLGAARTGGSTQEPFTMGLAPGEANLDDLRRLVQRSVARNPFRTDRSRASARYGAIGSAAARSIDPSPPLPYQPLPLRLLGTASGVPGSELAAIEVIGEGPRLLRLGDAVAGFRLDAVTPTEARLRGQDSVIVLRTTLP